MIVFICLCVGIVCVCVSVCVCVCECVSVSVNVGMCLSMSMFADQRSGKWDLSRGRSILMRAGAGLSFSDRGFQGCGERWLPIDAYPEERRKSKNAGWSGDFR